ncbi:centrosomal protein of 131 kDa-like isoform X2 [Gigantopelta aegis]|nr:centrosomal protein of 131 kDa-like isoform X2 [Gigantopelta aegis]XP_041362384.1 centrosomal protein of 131 kDa-like isoform X2 [Gigantopelta aegis]
MTFRSGSGDDLNLSLTGSQIVTPGKRSSSSHLKRPNSLVDVRTSKSSNHKYTSGCESDAEKRMSSRTRNLSSGMPPASQRSVSSAGTASARNSTRKPKTKETDFLALFESSHQPKIRSRPVSASSIKNKKPAVNASKLLWEQSSQGRKSTGVPNSSRSNTTLDTTLDTDRTEPHNIFRPETVSSSSDEEDIEESLSRSINKLQSLQNQLSGVNRNNSSHDDGDVLNSQRSDTTPRSTPLVNSIANNMTSQGLLPRSRPSLSSMENSYQNIKPKAPVNQVRKSTPNQVANHQVNDISKSSSNQVGLNVAEDYIKTLNSSAVKIQLWFRRHRKRRLACEAALKRMLDHKRQEREDKQQDDKRLSLLENGTAEQSVDRKQMREERAKRVRQQAIQDLHKRREERRESVKQKAEQEVAYLQASGKITKNPSKARMMGSKKPGKSDVKKDASRETATPEESPRNRLDTPQVTSESSPRENGAEAALVSARESENPGKSQTRTTLNDLFDTLKKLEEEETFVSARQEKKNSWLEDLTKSREVGEWGDTNLTMENLEKLNSPKDGLSKSGFLTDDKLQSIMSFLDEVQVNDRLTEIDSEINKMNEQLDKPALVLPSGEEIAQMEQAQAVASEVTSAVLSQRLEIDEKKRTITMLQKALNQQRELTVRHAKETEKEMKRRLDLQKDEYEETVKRHLSFIDQLIEDKKTLSEKCEQLVKELKEIDKKYRDKFKSMEENHSIEINKLKEISAATEKIRREKWIDEKTKKIKEMTVKGLEPEIQRLIAKHKGEMKKIKQIQEAELLEADERAAQRYVKMTEELRNQLAEEKEAACARERQLAMERYEKQLQQEEQAYQQQRRRLYAEVQEEKDRLSQQAMRQRTELDKLQQQLEDSHTHALEAMKLEFEKARAEQDNRHSTELRELHERLKLEKESWEENYMKKKETWLAQKERELKEMVRKERDQEIDLVIRRLEEDATASREDCERTAENKIRRLRDKYNSEVQELERSEREAVKKYSEIKAAMTEVEAENERLKVIIRQKDLELADNKRLTEKLHEERGHVSDIIRQEFADRIVQTEEESRRVKMEMAELKAKHRVELDRVKNDAEDLRRQKDEELDEVHKRVKQAILKKEEVVQQLRQQYQAATKRADHLEGLLEQQRKQLLRK